MENLKKNQEIPKATAKRIPLYFRYLKTLDQSGVKRIKSNEFSQMIQIPSATIRRDFSHFGELGRSGYGYDVPYLIEVFSNILNTEIEKRIALIGVGNLGKALVNNNFRRNANLNIVAAFDSNPEVIGTKVNDIKVNDISEIKEVIKKEGITTVITTVPSNKVQQVIDEAVEAGVTAILNFAPKRLKVPHNVQVQYIDLTTELQTLIYYDENYNNPDLKTL
ncbi:redox-sensing transcriptional repressor Rex [Vagococcus fluvialis]|jgi:redox-sensing transcriptional repressor|uniref:Redox-sensing transcriptional repressor Rex n=1 Tax=Vagococcus fluvialis TaxID=2738 RepID=A0A369AZT9_9ENTE|nr:redox-sensing transcriptional repressor Rex [Vagococcus fluvialis]OTP34017.1 redox-sensing transcriptional repressor Rex 2 [Enterococcus sp. 6C8_DIV0013]MBO0419565.1 redox-sensing transcriptional repressor Rex [Vagococcus fluvialis]MBO0429747.1 redox-sensing transcriptional repressor Rex [Vagococcus fluvialis]MBO0437854.1 redox-sensing transcriptional repressor Rex [Vagococcus fluvialis]MBO0442372.1 redox-sensing transcriptional repressor Rex [Vagococcus fluvialis]